MSNDKVREAWICELATRYNKDTKTYSNWVVSLSLDKYHVPDGSIRNLKHLVEEVEWQPIETAPKDGTVVLLYMADGDMTTASYKAYKNLDGYNWRNWGLVVSGGYAEDNELNDEPTHWQPLPNPPEKK